LKQQLLVIALAALVGLHGCSRFVPISNDSEPQPVAEEPDVAATKTQTSATSVLPGLVALEVDWLLEADLEPAETPVWATEQARVPVAQRFGASGAELGAEVLVNTTTADYQRHPAAAISDAGFIVAWDSYVAAGEQIVARHFAADGAPVSGEVVISDTAGVHTLPAIARSADGGHAVVWESAGMPGGLGADVAIRCFNGSGAAIGASQRVNVTLPGKQGRPGVATDGKGLYLVVWESIVGDSDVLARRFDSTTCAPVGGELDMHGVSTAQQSHPSVTATADGFAVVWQSEGQDGDGFGIFGQLVTAAGGTMSAEQQLNTSTDNSQTRPRIARSPAGQLVVVWETQGYIETVVNSTLSTTGFEEADGGAIKVQAFDQNLQPLGPDYVANLTVAGDQHQPAVAATAEGVIVVWTGPDQDGDGTGIVARRLGY